MKFLGGLSIIGNVKRSVDIKNYYCDMSATVVELSETLQDIN